MTTEPNDSYARIVAELRDYERHMHARARPNDGNLICVLADRLEKLSAASVQVTDWQPIESAPKDGTRVLVVSMPCVTVMGAFFGSPRQGRYGHSAWVTDESVRPFPATHWMPLPPAPQGEDHGR